MIDVATDLPGGPMSGGIVDYTVDSKYGQFHIHDHAEEWDWEEPLPDFLPDEARLAAIEQELHHVTPSTFTEFAVRIRDADKKSLEPFSFKGREYLRRLYDTPFKRTLFKCGRQVEKCGSELSEITKENGSVVQLKDIEVGDRVVGLALGGARTGVGTVSWKSERCLKPCIRIRTRQGHEVTVALTHPMRTWNNWDEGGALSVGRRLAVVRGAGNFVRKAGASDDVVIFAAYMIAEGDCCGTPSFTQNVGPVLDEMVEICDRQEIEYNIHERGAGVMLKFVHPEGGESVARHVLKAWEIYDERSSEKHVPGIVWSLGQEQTALFLNRLWAGDGHCSLQGSSYHIEYDTISERLSRDVQRLLWKFGIPTSFRRWKPTLYKGTDKWAYKLRVETQKGARRFVEHIGALGKTEDLPLLEVDDSSNRDVYPPEIAGDIRAIHRSREGFSRRGRWVPQPSLRSAGLREKPKHPPTKAKLKEYIEFFRSDPRFDQDRVDQLAAHLDTDLYWDEIVEIEDVGEQPCYDITVEGTDSFIADGFITHNSTTLGNKLLSYACINVAFNALYVSPSNAQTKTFSNDRLKETIVTSPHLAVWTNNKLLDNVFEKKLINRSQLTLRYAFLNADRVRGIPADFVAIDEIQDVIVDNIPVIEECASHSPFKLFMYSGTPKSTDNTIEHFWQNFTLQNEWVVPCEHHGTPNNPSSWYWNILDEDNVGPAGLMCDRCHRLLNVTHPHAQWARVNDVPKVDQPYEGYRVPQLMVPWIEWDEILQKQKQYSPGRFYNEVLGLSYDSGTRPLTQADIIDNCSPALDMTSEGLERVRGLLGATSRVYAGIDWGTGEGSYTVLTLGAYIGGRFAIFYVHRFEGQETDPQVQLAKIRKVIKDWNVARAGVDYGGGFHPNDKLLKAFGMSRIVKYQYTNTAAGKVIWDDRLHRFQVNRTEVMSDIFNAIKRRSVLSFPTWGHFKDPFGMDMLNIFSEYNEIRRMDEYKRTPGTTDDTFHSILYCFLASMIDHPRPDIMATAA